MLPAILTESVLRMKIFISHSSKNKNFGEKLVELLRNIGIKESEIIYTSNTAYGIPIGQNIFNWLKSQITENPFVIYLLSEEYYQSIACLNEMGAAWIIENKHAAIFTPNFNLSSKEFQNGALDPREIGFYINDEDRVLSFIQLLSEDFDITKNHLLISQSVKKFLADISNIKTFITSLPTSTILDIKEPIKKNEKVEERKVIENPTTNQTSNKTDLFSKFTDLILQGKLKDDELILIHYIIETGRFKLMTGWQESQEIDNIVEWEKINEIENKLSKNYSSVLKRLELRNFTEVSAVTSSNNPKELKIKEEISQHLLDLPQDIQSKIHEVIAKNHFEYTDETEQNDMWNF